MWNKGLWFSDCVQVDDKIWFASGNYNGLYCYDIAGKRTDYIADFPEEFFNVEQLFFKTRRYKDNLIFIPMLAGAVHIFNLTSKFFSRIEIPLSGTTLFADGRIFGRYLYLFGCNYYGILKVNLDSRRIETTNGAPEQIGKKIGMDKGNPLFGLQSVAVGNKVYLPSWQSNHLVEYDMEKESYRFYEAGSKENRYYGVYQIGDSIGLLAWNNGNAVIWNEERWEEVFYCEKCSLDKQMCMMGNAVWVIPSKTKKIYKIDEKSKKVEEVWIDEKDHSEKNIEFAGVYENQLLLCALTGDWYKISNDGEEKVEKFCSALEEPRSPEKLIWHIVQDLMKEKPIGEKGFYSIDCLIEGLGLKWKMAEVGNRTQIGRRIYESMCSVLKED